MASAGLRIEGWRGESARRPPKRGKTEASEVRKTLISVFASTVVSRLDCSRHRPRRSRAGGRVSLSLSRLALGRSALSSQVTGGPLCADRSALCASRLAKDEKGTNRDCDISHYDNQNQSRAAALRRELPPGGCARPGKNLLPPTSTWSHTTHRTRGLSALTFHQPYGVHPELLPSCRCLNTHCGTVAVRAM